MLKELAPHDPGPPEPRSTIDDVVLIGRFVDTPREPVPYGLNWPWHAYAVSAVAVYLAARSDLGALVAPEWLPAVLACALLCLGMVAVVRRQLVVAVARRMTSAAVRALIPRPHLRQALFVEPREGALRVTVFMDDPAPWPPFGSRQGDTGALVMFIGGWIADREDQFEADRMILPAETGRPVVYAIGASQPFIWLGAALGVLALLNVIPK